MFLNMREYSYIVLNVLTHLQIITKCLVLVDYVPTEDGAHLGEHKSKTKRLTIGRRNKLGVPMVKSFHMVSCFFHMHMLKMGLLKKPYVFLVNVR